MDVIKNMREVLRYSDPTMLEFALGIVIVNLAFTHPGLHTPCSAILVAIIGVLQTVAIIFRFHRRKRAFANLMVATIYLYLVIRHIQMGETYSMAPYIFGGLFSLWCLYRNYLSKL